MSGDELARAAAEVDRIAAEAEALAAEETTSTALVRTSGTGAVELKQQMGQRRAALARKRVELREAQEAMRSAMERRMSQAMEVMGPLQEQVALLEEGIWTVNLYLGRDETISHLVEGAPAPAETPITVRQMVLAMDEETMIAPDSDGIDWRNIDLFDEWVADPDHLHQVLPEQRGVVVLVPRFRSKEVADPWAQQAHDEANRQSYWLIRNGENVYRMHTNLIVGRRLVPERDEFTSLFTVRGRPLEPGSSEWLRAEKAAEGRQRHYMRIALVLQGLIERTAVLHPLPDPQVSFLTPRSYDEGHVQIITDAELAIGTGREPFRQWQQRLMAELRKGMRVVGAWHGESGFWSANRSGGDYGHGRVSPRYAPTPEDGEIYTIEDETTDGYGSRQLIIRYKRTDRRHGYEHRDSRGREYGQWGQWEYKTRASCAIERGDWWILPFDLVTVPEMEAYLDARLDRHEYASMIPLLKSTIAAKLAEAEAEAPFRLLLVGEIRKRAILTGHVDVTVEEIEAELQELIDWWKLSNRHHRPLVDPSATVQAKAIRMIVEEWTARHESSYPESMAEQFASLTRKAHPGIVAVAARRDGSFVAVEPMREGEGTWARLISRAWGKRGLSKVEKVDEWKLITPAQIRTWEMVETSPEWDGWDLHVSRDQVLTDPEIESLLQQVRDADETIWHGRYRDDGEQYRIAIGYGTERRRRPKLYAFMWDRTEPDVDHDHLLTTNPKGLEVRYIEIGWKRTRDGVRIDEHGSAHTDEMRSGDSVPWEFPKYASQNGTYSVLWLDEDEAARVLSAHRSYAAMMTVRGEGFDASRRVDGAVREAWERAVEARAFERFMEDYGDATLWEDHRKSRNMPDYDAHTFVSTCGELLIESGVTLAEIDGMTVEELLERARPLAIAREGTVRDVGSMSWHRRDLMNIDEDTTVPEQIAGITIELGLVDEDGDPISEDEDEGWDDE